MSGSASNLSRNTRRRIGIGLVVVCGLLAGCSDSETGGESRDPAPELPTATRSAVVTGTATEPDDAASPTPFLRPTSISSPTVAPLPAPVASALERVALERGVNRSDVALLTYTQETWSSTALGCPEPGRSYAQIVTSGYELFLMVLGELVIYHVDQSGAALVECERDASG